MANRYSRKHYVERCCRKVANSQSGWIHGPLPHVCEGQIPNHGMVPFATKVLTMEPRQLGREVEEYGIKIAREADLCRNNEKDKSAGSTMEQSYLHAAGGTRGIWCRIHLEKISHKIG
eukprot:SAG31_NODE_109_length_24587_cov_111.480848_1_plen_118_part_00